MIYTIGDKESYEKGIDDCAAQGKSFLKLGAGFHSHVQGYYQGGLAFLTKEEAEKFITEREDTKGYAVYGLDADWEKHCVQYPDESCGRLITSRPVVRL